MFLVIIKTLTQQRAPFNHKGLISVPCPTFRLIGPRDHWPFGNDSVANEYVMTQKYHARFGPRYLGFFFSSGGLVRVRMVVASDKGHYIRIIFIYFIYRPKSRLPMTYWSAILSFWNCRQSSKVFCAKFRIDWIIETDFMDEIRVLIWVSYGYPILHSAPGSFNYIT